MTYNPAFKKTLKKADEWISAKITKRTIVYGGELESKDSDIELVNYRNL